MPQNLDSYSKEDKNELFKKKHESEVAWVDDWVE